MVQLTPQAFVPNATLLWLPTERRLLFVFLGSWVVFLSLSLSLLGIEQAVSTESTNVPNSTDMCWMGWYLWCRDNISLSHAFKRRVPGTLLRVRKFCQGTTQPEGVPSTD